MKFLFFLIFIVSCTIYSPSGIQEQHFGKFNDEDKVYYKEQSNYQETYRTVQFKENNLVISFYYIGDSLHLFVIDSEKLTYQYNGKFCTLNKYYK